MVAREAAGMLLMALAGLGVAMMVILEGVLKRLHLPFYALMGTTNLVMAISFAVAVGCWGEWSRLSLRQYKWVMARGLLGCISYALMLLAVIQGAPLGDASALQSINVVVAALLGRAFLGEPLRWLHVVALCFSITGAMFITKPQVLLGLAPAPPGGKPWLGYGLALAAGTTIGSTFIAARKSQGINPLVLSASVTLHEGLLLLLLPTFGTVEDVPLRELFVAPAWVTAVVSAGLVLAVVLGSCALSAGAQMCPAAAASTIFTSMNMSLSFAAQIMLHGEAPDALSLAGAGLLLLGVASMAVARALFPASAKLEAGTSPLTVEPGDAPPGHEPEVPDSDASARGGEVDDTSSLASFVASEFSGLSPSSAHERSVVRQRRTLAAAALPATQVIGIASA